MKTKFNFWPFVPSGEKLLAFLILLWGGGLSAFAQQCCPLVYKPLCVPTSACTGFDIQKVGVKNLYNENFNQLPGNEATGNPSTPLPCGSTGQGYTSFLNGPLRNQPGGKFTFKYGTTYRMDVKMARIMGLSAWIDFNGNGNFGDPGEQIFSFIPGTPDVKNVTFAIPAGTDERFTIMRIRSSSNAFVAPQQLALNQWCAPVTFGETEDYPVFIDRYSCEDLYYNSCGDNLNFAGINIMNDAANLYSGYYPPLYQNAIVVSGSTYNLSMAYAPPHPSSDGYVLSAWIDFNNNSSFDDPGERLIGGIIPTGSVYGPTPITIPNNMISVGERRMRVMLRTWNQDFLGIHYYNVGMVVDFTLQILPNMGTLASGNANMCPPADPAPISFSTLPTGSVNYNWYYKDGVQAQPTGAPDATWTFIPTANPITGATYPTYDPPAGLTTTRTYACYITPKIASSSYPNGWANGVRQIRVKSGYCLGRMAVDHSDLEALDNQTASLSQNIPNPFTTETTIPCFIPEETKTASLEIYGMDGRKVQQIQLSGTGEQNVKIESKMLPASGMYLYTLVIDGQKQPMQRMVLAK